MAGSSGGAVTAVAAGCGGTPPRAMQAYLAAASEACRRRDMCYVSANGGPPPLLHALAPGGLRGTGPVQDAGRLAKRAC
jgi:hypothetical protein